VDVDVSTSTWISFFDMREAEMLPWWWLLDVDGGGGGGLLAGEDDEMEVEE